MSACAKAPAPSARLSRGLLASLVIVFAVIWFSNLDYRKLTRPDEGRYAEIAREMAQSGDWVTPRLNDLKYFEKPPLQYWMTAAAFRLFGEQHWTARWWPATTAFGCVLLAFWSVRRLSGDEELALMAAAALGGCSGFLINTHINTLDGGLAACLTVVLLAFLLAQRPGATAAETRNGMLVVWAALALAVLSKGLVGLVLPGAALALYVLIERDWALLTRLHWGKGLALFFLITTPWFIAVSLANPEFAHFFFIHEHFNRFLTSGHKREGSSWYFIPILLFGLMPWTPVVAWRWRSGWQREGAAGSFQPRRLLLIWSGFIFLFFSVSHSKLPSYILPMFPALALFAALEMRQLSAAQLGRVSGLLAVLGGTLLLVVLFGGDWLAARFAKESSPLPMVQQMVPWVQASVFSFTLGAVVATGLFVQRASRLAGVLALAFGSLTAGILAMNGHEQLSPLSSSYPMVRAIQANPEPFNPAIPFYSIEMHDHTLPFYLQRPVTLVQYIDEFALGLAAEPTKGIAQVADWQAHWIGLERGYAIMRPDNYARFAAQGLPMRVLARDPRRVMVSRR